MEIVELEAVDSRVTRLRCLFCKHWGRFEDLKPLNQDGLEQAPLPIRLSPTPTICSVHPFS